MNKHSHTDTAQPHEGTAPAQLVEMTSPQTTASVALPTAPPYGIADAPAAPLTGVLGTVLALAFVLALAWILLKALQRTGIARNRSGKAVLQVVRGRIRSNNGVALTQAAAQGLGITRQPDFIAEPFLARGEVVELLQDFAPPALGIYAVLPSNRYIPHRVNVLIEHLAKALRAA